MARFAIALLFMTVVAGLALGVASTVRQSLGGGAAGHALTRQDKERGAMRKLSGVLLVALIVYAGFWGGA